MRRKKEQTSPRLGRIQHFLHLLLIAFLVNIFIKSICISSIPPLLTEDETYYAAQAQSILAGGTDLTGKWRPWDFAPANPIYSELTGLTYAPGFILFPGHTQIAIKVVPILFGSLIPLLLALIVYKLFRKELFFRSTLIIATLNPWIYQFSRMSFDSLASTFFYLLGISMLLYFPRWKSLISLLPFTLGFFQYQGHKPLLVPLIALTLLYMGVSHFKWPLTPVSRAQLLGKYTYHLIVLVAASLLVGIYLIRLPTLLSSTRISEFAIDRQQLREQTNIDRRLSLQNPFVPIFTNKGVELASQLLQRFVASFHLPWLFLRGDAHTDTFAVTAFGFLYTIDALFIFIALIYIWAVRRWRKEAGFITLLVLIGTIPNILKTEKLWLTFRGSFMIMGLVLLSSIGMALAWHKGTRLLRVILIGIYALAVIPFFYHYVFRYPLLATKDFSFYTRVVASYIKRQPTVEFSIHADTMLFESILTYNHLITPQTLPSLHSAYAHRQFAIENIRLVSGCFDPEFAASQSSTFIVDYRTEICSASQGPSIATPSGTVAFIAIGSLTDSLSQYYIYNDHLCEPESLSQYTTVKENKFSLEKLPTPLFCETFFSLPSKGTRP